MGLPRHTLRNLSLVYAAQRSTSVAEAEKLGASILQDAVRGALNAQVLSAVRALAAESMPTESRPPSTPPPPAVRCAPSPACGGTIGVFAGQAIGAGRLAAVYPGCVFVPTREEEAEEPPRALLSPYLVVNDYGGFYLDGWGWAPQTQVQNLAQTLGRRVMKHPNRIGVGNYLNHPPKGVLPNCVPVGFDYPAWEQLAERDTTCGWLGMPESSAKTVWAMLIPHVEVDSGGRVLATVSGPLGKPGEQRPERTWRWPRAGLALVTVLPVQPGEELCWDYCMTPARPAQAEGYPDWYHPVDEAGFKAAVSVAA